MYRILAGQSCILSIASCLNDKQSKVNAIAEGKTKLITIPGDRVKEWIDKYPSWRKFVHNLYYERLEEVLSLVDNIAFMQVDTRLLLKLRELQSIKGNSIKITHQNLEIPCFYYLLNESFTLIKNVIQANFLLKDKPNPFQRHPEDFPI